MDDSRGTARILVVDDEGAIRELLRAILAKAGYQVVLAANGLEAVEAVRDSCFDLVLMDLHMPVMNGLAATRAIRKLAGPRSQVPIVGTSANVPLHHVSSLLTGGMNDHLGKPFRRKALLAKVAAWVTPESQPAPAPASAGGAAFDDACELMGRPWMVRALTELNAKIDTFVIEQETALVNARLSAQAHALVALAAVLGFPTLSARCSELEEACRSGRGVQSALQQAIAEASQARKTAVELIARL